MQTELLAATDSAIAKAAELLQAGELVAIPTETVYGLAANALDASAVSKIFKAKGRPQDNPLIVHIASMEMLAPLVADIPPLAKKLTERFWPGPLTIVLPKSSLVPDAVSAGLDTVAVRMPAHDTAREIIRKSGLPLAAPSANLSTRPSPTLPQHVFDDLNGKIALIIDGGVCDFGVESTVVALREDTVRVLRPGGVTADEIAAMGIAVELDASIRAPHKGGAVQSPGVKYKHYTPNARVVMIKGDFDAYAQHLKKQDSTGVYGLVFDSDIPRAKQLTAPALSYGDTPAEQARQLFARLRELDALGAMVIYARCPSEEGIGLAVYNRLIRAAGFEVIELD